MATTSNAPTRRNVPSNWTPRNELRKRRRIEALAERYEIARVQARFEEIASCEGAVTVYFTKRTDGHDRRMVCLYDDRKALRKRFGYDVTEHSLMPVWDVEKGEIRMISLDAVRKVVHDGQVLYEKREEEKSLGELTKEMHELF